MKRKQQESIIRLAFGEYKSETEKQLLEASLANDGCDKELELLSSIKDGLQLAGQNTPECQVSVERIRDAILNQNIRESRNPATFWSWASVGAAACAFLFVLSQNRNATVEPRLVSNLERSSIIEENNSLLKSPEDSRVATVWQPAPRKEADPEPNNELNARQENASDPSQTPTKWADITTAVASRAAETLATVASRDDALRNAHAGSMALGNKSLIDSGNITPDEESEPIILINSDTDGDTGAQVATEVESVENVHIGG